MGERDRARLLLQEGKSFFDSLPPGMQPNRPIFWCNWRGSSPIKPWHGCRSSRITRIPPPATMTWPRSPSELATDHPAEAERFFNLREGSGPVLPTTDTLRLCRRLARVDPPRARRVAASLSGPGARACAWAFVALGLAEKGNADASEALDHAIQEIDRLRESGRAPNGSTSSAASA